MVFPRALRRRRRLRRRALTLSRKWRCGNNLGDMACGHVCLFCAKEPCPACLDASCCGEGQGNGALNTVIISKDLWNRSRAIIPCKLRAHFNDLVGVKAVMVSMEGIPFSMEVEKSDLRTVEDVNGHRVAPDYNSGRCISGPCCAGWVYVHTKDDKDF
ncbi:hypothetical protein EJB05_13860, partial [Eragrostis curvula]